MNDVLYRDKKWLKDQYSTKSITQIARESSHSRITITSWLCKLGIPTRSIGENHHICRNKNHFTMDNYLYDFIIGELLGDGCIYKISEFSAVYTHVSKYREYVEWLVSIFGNYGIEIMGDKIYRKDGIFVSSNKPYVSYSITTRSYRKFLEIYKYMYNDICKYIPPTVEFSPLVVRQWYIGDGSLTKQIGGRNRFVTIATNGFSKTDINILIDKFKEIGLKVTRVKAGFNSKGVECFIINISTHDTQKFFDYIGPCPIEIKDVYGYKWP